MPDTHKPPRVGRWYTYMGCFSVPPWLFDASPLWLHEAADWFGGVEPSPWGALAPRGAVSDSLPAPPAGHADSSDRAPRAATDVHTRNSSHTRNQETT